MAVQEDYKALTELTQRFFCSQPRTIVGCSLDQSQISILEYSFPAHVLNLTVKDWNLNDPCPVEADLIVACNVFQYSDNPTRWINNALVSCKQLWIQDLFCRRRGSGELGSDGDKMRYGWGAAIAGAPTLDLNQFCGRILDYWCYDAGSFLSQRTCVNFVAVLRGEL